MMSIPSASDIDSIGEAISKYPSDRIKGVTLASLIRSAARGVNIREIVGIPTGPGALTKFASGYLGQFIQQIDRATLPAEESDVVFVKTVAAPNVPLAPEIEPQLTENCWSVFVRPSSPKKLVLLSDGADLKLGIRSPSDVGSARVIDGVTHSEFKAISDEYLGNASEHGVPMELAAELQGSATYTRFVELLKGAGGSQFLNWSKYRREKLHELFASRIDALGLGADVKRGLLSQLEDSQINAKRLTQESRASHQFPWLTSSGGGDDEAQARSMLKLVSDSMTLDEIRALHIPLGRVLDAMKKINKR